MWKHHAHSADDSMAHKDGKSTLWRLLFIGFGNVGKEVARLLLLHGERYAEEFHCLFQVNGIVTLSKGTLYNPKGLCLTSVLSTLSADGNFLNHPFHDKMDAKEAISTIECDIVIELTTLDIVAGEPASSHIRHALECGKHVITANKGPIAHQYHSLRELSQKKCRRFLFEGTVMDGTPVFNMFGRCMLGNRILRVRGILNSTTNYILQQMESIGMTMDEAVAEAQRQGFAEADPSNDIEGWDSATKLAALMNVTMNGCNITPQAIHREGISRVSIADIERAKKRGFRLKLVCEGRRCCDDASTTSCDGTTTNNCDHVADENQEATAATSSTHSNKVTMLQTDDVIIAHKTQIFTGSVRLTEVPLNDPLASVDGTSSALTLVSDILGTVT